MYQNVLIRKALEVKEMKNCNSLTTTTKVEAPLEKYDIGTEAKIY